MVVDYSSKMVFNVSTSIIAKFLIVMFYIFVGVDLYFGQPEKNFGKFDASWYKFKKIKRTKKKDFENYHYLQCNDYYGLTVYGYSLYVVQFVVE